MLQLTKPDKGFSKRFFNNEKHKKTRKNFMEATLTARLRRSSHEFFSSPFVFFVVKKIPVTWLYRLIPIGTTQD